MGILTKEENNDEGYYKSSFEAIEDNKINQIGSKLNSLIKWLNQFYEKVSKLDLEVKELKEIDTGMQERINKIEEKINLNENSQINYEEIKSLKEAIEKNKKNFVGNIRFKNFTKKVNEKLNKVDSVFSEIEDMKMILKKVADVAKKGKENSKQNKREIKEVGEILKNDLSKIISYEEKVSSTLSLVNSLKIEIENLKNENLNLKKESSLKSDSVTEEIKVPKKVKVTKKKKISKKEINHESDTETTNGEDLEGELKSIKKDMNSSKSNSEEVVDSDSEQTSEDTELNSDENSELEGNQNLENEVSEEDDLEENNNSLEDQEEISEEIPQDSNENILNDEETTDKGSDDNLESLEPKEEEKGFFKKGLEKLGFK